MSHDATYPFPEGDLHVTIIAAKSRSAYWGDQWQVRPEARLAISSSLDEKGEPGYVKIRGRKYRVASRRSRVHALTEAAMRENSNDPDLWQRETPLRRQEFANELDRGVGESTAARTRLNQMVTEAAIRFEADHPDWRLVSERLELEGELDGAEAVVSGARDALRKAEARAADLRARIASYTA
ncbi:hypothetical protein CIB93_09120 [Streptomyces sp. WZ.A104]|uniref:hypothetical protein n=1 Tax=Streptomyces sp. WZ.A104 TaxID=2023771 RepID=UPI000BBC3683|nr:hypothetical protein [Streptomyces sp. WZ.A104]PCG86382.1 hypothetical protein CIB93_09120 [Streptomyces sp. WZ.A104]